VAEFVAKHFEGNAVLKRQGNRRGETIHQARNGRALLGRGDEDFARVPIFVKPNSQIPLIPAHVEVVHEGFPLIGQAPPNGHGCRAIFDFRHRLLATNPNTVAFSLSLTH
jgi:hypothetical protein